MNYPTVYFFVRLQVLELGLASAYQTDAEVRGLVRKVMALSMVPQTEVTLQFERLRRQAATPELTTLFESQLGTVD